MVHDYGLIAEPSCPGATHEDPCFAPRASLDPRYSACSSSAQTPRACGPADHRVGLPDGDARVPAGAHEGGRHAARAGEVRRHPARTRRPSRRPASRSCRSTRCRPAEQLPLAESLQRGRAAGPGDEHAPEGARRQPGERRRAGEAPGGGGPARHAPAGVRRAATPRPRSWSTRSSALPATFVRERIEAHGALNSYYRADDIDAGIIRHSTRLIELNKALTPEQRVPADRQHAHRRLREPRRGAGRPGAERQGARRAAPRAGGTGRRGRRGRAHAADARALSAGRHAAARPSRRRRGSTRRPARRRST